MGASVSCAAAAQAATATSTESNIGTAATHTSNTTTLTQSAASLTQWQRKARMLRLKDTKDVEEAKAICSAIVNEWNGKGLHVITATQKLASFPDGVDEAIEHLLTCVEKFGVTHKAREGDYLRPLKKNQGYAYYLRRFEVTFAIFFSIRMEQALSTNQIVKWNCQSILDRLESILDRVLCQPPCATRTYNIGRSHPMRLPWATGYLKMLSSHRIAVVKATKVGGRLPQEIIDIIADMVVSKPGMPRQWLVESSRAFATLLGERVKLIAHDGERRLAPFVGPMPATRSRRAAL